MYSSLNKVNQRYEKKHQPIHGQHSERLKSRVKK
jgi:hypothetical protein